MKWLLLWLITTFKATFITAKDRSFILAYRVINSSSLDGILYCKSTNLCESFLGRQRLIRTIVQYNGTPQYRWYIEVLSDETYRYDRFYGAIQIDPNSTSNMIWKNRTNVLSEWLIVPDMHLVTIEEQQIMHDPTSESLDIFLKHVIYFSGNKTKLLNFYQHLLPLEKNSSSAVRFLLCDYYALKGDDLLAENCYLQVDFLEEWNGDTSLKFQLLVNAFNFYISHMVLLSRLLGIIDVAKKICHFTDTSINDWSQHQLSCMEMIYHSLTFNLTYGDSTDSIASLSACVKDIEANQRTYSSFLVVDQEYLYKLSHFINQLPSILSMISKQDHIDFQLIGSLDPVLALAQHAVSVGATDMAIHTLTRSLLLITAQTTTITDNISVFEVIENYLTSEELLLVVIQHDHLFHAYLYIISQTLSPVIISTRNSSSWLEEAVTARKLFIKLYQTFIKLCSDENNRCKLQIQQQSVVTRAHFLLAYQGLGLYEAWLQSRHLYNQDEHFYLQDGLLAQLHTRFLHSLSPHLQLQTYPLDYKEATQKVKVLFVCYSLTRHSVGRLLSRIILALSSSQYSSKFEVYTISDHYHPSAVDKSRNGVKDDVFESMISFPSADWFTLPAFDFGHTYHTVIKNVLDLKIDVVVFSDLLMQSSLSTWAGQQRLGQVQVVFWGHPFTTGLGDVFDYFITSRHFEPKLGLDISHRMMQFSEQLVQFESLSFLLVEPEPVDHHTLFPDRKIDQQDEVRDRQEVMQWLYEEGFSVYSGKFNASHDQHSADIFPNLHLYGALQSLMKMHPLFDQVLVSILRHDPLAVLVLTRNPKQPQWQLAWQRRLLTTIQHQVKEANNALITEENIVKRIVFVNQMKHEKYASLLCHMDTLLDPIPFGGGVTLCDGIAGHCPGHHIIPFITAGRLQSVHRIGAGLAAQFSAEVAVVNADTPSGAGSDCDEDASNHVEVERYRMQQPEDFWRKETLDYAMEAIKLAERSHSNRFQSEETVEAKLNRVETIDRIVYRDIQVIEEWAQFIVRIADVNE